MLKIKNMYEYIINFVRDEDCVIICDRVLKITESKNLKKADFYAMPKIDHPTYGNCVAIFVSGCDDSYVMYIDIDTTLDIALESMYGEIDSGGTSLVFENPYVISYAGDVLIEKVNIYTKKWLTV